MKWCKDILLLLVTGLLVSAAGCDSFIYDNYPVGSDPEDLVTLVLDIGLVAPTRAAADNAREEMHDLRIVLLDDKGAVEYNEHIIFDDPLTEYKEGTPGYQFIRTKPGSKKIFLVANEKGVNSVQLTDSYEGADRATLSGQSLTAVLESRPAVSPDAAEPTDFEDLVKSIYFVPGDDYSGMNIPLSSSYEFNIPDEKAGERVVREFYLVHAATKFEFEFINNRLSPVRIDALSISSIADNMYLMANFGATPAEEKKVKWEEGGETQTAPWIDWLKKVSDATTAHPKDNPDKPEDDNEAINAGFGWITDYELPPGATHTDRRIIQGSAETYEIPVTASATYPYKGVPVTYFPESKYIPTGGSGQQYSFSITLKDTENSITKTFQQPLTDIDVNGKIYENLAALFRNTHVKITCTLGYDEQDIDLTLRVGICPWYEETIDIPAFD